MHEEIKHDKLCFCEECFYWKLENPEIMETDPVDNSKFDGLDLKSGRSKI